MLKTEDALMDRLHCELQRMYLARKKKNSIAFYSKRLYHYEQKPLVERKLRELYCSVFGHSVMELEGGVDYCRMCVKRMK